MSHAGRPRAVLDSDIIYSRVLHDLVGRAARDLRLLSLFWSEELLAEARKSLEEKSGYPQTQPSAGSTTYRRTSPRGASTSARLPALTSLV